MSHPSLSTPGNIINIQHFCVDDGPGIRTTVFFKGCPLHCAWCHNPETQEKEREIFYRADRCHACGACVAACSSGAHTVDENGVHRLDREKCIRCGTCASLCLFDALEISGDSMTAEAVVADLLSDAIFYRTSGGGITLSGGEPTAQPQFAEAILAACKAEGLHTAMETCAVCPPATLRALAAVTDLFLLDWKLSDDALHKQYTGVSNRLIKENLALLHQLGANVVLRCPMIPDVNMTEDHYDGIVSLANTYANISQIDLEPYHPLGVGKSAALGKSAPYQRAEFLEADALTEVRNSISERVTCPVFITGSR